MKKTSQILYLLLTLAVVFLPLNGVMAGVSGVPFGVADSDLSQVVHSHDAGNSHDAEKNSHATENVEKDCHDHNMTDCAACAHFFTLKSHAWVRDIMPAQNLYIDYSVPVIALALPQEIRPPII